MIEKDYIMKLMQQFFKDLEKLVSNQREKGDIQNIQVQLCDLYKDYFKKDESFFYNESYLTIIEYLESKDCNVIDHMEMLAELLYHDALIKQNSDLKRNLLVKSLELFKYLNENSKTFSLERNQKIDFIYSYIG